MMFLRSKRLTSLITPLYYRNTQQQKTASNLDEEKLHRAKQIEFRKRLMEKSQLNSIKESIETTKGNFNPFIQYLRLFRTQLLYMAVFGFFATALAIMIKIAGTHNDTFTKKKKFVLVSDEFERTLEPNLRQTFTTHFGFAQRPSNRLQQQCKNLEAYLKQITERDYKILVVQAQDKIVIILPGSIILSKSMLVSADRTDVQQTLLLMETLFNKKTHIKQLALANILHFISHWIRPTNVSDVNMLKIYSKAFEKNQIQDCLRQIQNKYSLPAESIRNSIINIIQNQQKHSSALSLKKRLESINQIQQS